MDNNDNATEKQRGKYSNHVACVLGKGGDVLATPSTYDPRVAELQQMLNAEGYTDPQGKALVVDGMMGPLTQYALDQRSASTVQGLPNYFGPEMSMPVSGSGIPNVTISGNTITTSRDGQFVNSTQIPKTSTTSRGSIGSTPTTIGSMNPQIGQLLATLQQRATAPLPAAESTPQYAAAKDLLQREGAEASTRAVQQMAARGVLRSSMTESALKRIEQEIVDRLATQIVPQVQQQLFAERQAELGGLRSDLQTALGMAQFDIGQMNAAQMAQMQAQQFDIEQMYRNAQLEQKAREFMLGLQDKEADRALRADLGYRNLNMQAQAQALSQARFASDQEYREWLKQKDITEQQGRTATSGYTSRILQFTDPEDAFAYLFNNATSIVNDGADMSKILAQFRTRFPEFYRSNNLDALLGIFDR